jgi:hypothetical protein
MVSHLLISKIFSCTFNIRYTSYSYSRNHHFYYFGVGAGVYLSEIANPKYREFLKPVIELFAGIPTVVLGFIMLVIGASFLMIC